MYEGDGTVFTIRTLAMECHGEPPQKPPSSLPLGLLPGLPAQSEIVLFQSRIRAEQRSHEPKSKLPPPAFITLLIVLAFALLMTPARLLPLLCFLRTLVLHFLHALGILVGSGGLL